MIACRTKHRVKHECIPVGCVPPAAVAVRGVSPGTPRDQTPPRTRQTPPDQAHNPHPPEQAHSPEPGTPLWTEWQTGVNILPYPKLRLRAVNMNSTCRSWLLFIYVSLRLRVQNWRRKWNFPLNFCTMRKLSECYSGIFQTQSSGCASGVDHIRNFTKLKILNIWIVKYLLNCKRYLSYNFWIFQKISECWVLENLDVHLEWTTSELEFKSENQKS